MSSHSRDIHSQRKKIIFSVYTYFKNLAKDSSQPEVSKYFLQAQQKTSEACGIHIKSVKCNKAEGSKALLNKESGKPSLTSPRKTFTRLYIIIYMRRESMTSMKTSYEEQFTSLR